MGGAYFMCLKRVREFGPLRLRGQTTNTYNLIRGGKHMNDTPLLSIFGAKISKDGKRLVVSLVSGEGESKVFYNTCIKLDNSQKTHAKVEKDGKHAIIKVVMLEDKPTNEDTPF